MDEQLELAERIKVSIKIGESHFREFKSALEQGPEGENPRAVRKISKDIAETLVAFANADGGELFVGIEDDGRTSGVPHNDEHIEKMLKAPFTNIHSETPLPTPRVLKIPIGGKGKAAGRNILYFTVPKGTEYVYLTSDGRCLQRHDRETRPVPAERIQYDRQERLSREYDRSFIDGADIGQLDPELLNRVTQKINPSLSPEKMLQFLDLAEWQPLGLSMRRAALLLFAKDINRWHPRSQVRVVKIAGNEIGVGKEFNVIRDDVVSDNIINILARTWDVIRPHLAITRLGTHAVFQETLIYPEEACMEALINALAHRDYSIEGRGIEIYIYDNRMEIVSPGGLLSTITIDEILRLNKAHQSRNAYVTRVLREMGYMRELGEGIPRIYALMDERDIATPNIEANVESFRMALYHRSVFSPKDQQWLDSLAQFILNRDEQRVVLLGKDGHLITPREIREVAKIVDTEDYRRLVESLQRKGILYSVRPDSELRRKYQASQRIDIGRFAIRPIGELLHFYDELVDILRRQESVERINHQEIYVALRRKSTNNPYCHSTTECIQSLRCLGFVDENNMPMQRLADLWQKRAKTNHKKA